MQDRREKTVINNTESVGVESETTSCRFLEQWDQQRRLDSKQMVKDTRMAD